VTLLAIETATDMVGAALLRDDGGGAERMHFGGRAHAELLAPAIEEVCAVSGCSVADVDVVAVDVGPGLFTGLRVGVATAKALAQALGIGVLGVGSLDVLAAAAAGGAGGAEGSLAVAPVGAGALSGAVGPVEAAPVGVVAALVDARRGEVFAAAYRFDRPVGAGPVPGPADAAPVDPQSVRLDRTEPMAPERAVDWLLEMAGDAGLVTVVGDGAVRYRSLLSVHSLLDLSLADRFAAPPPLALAALARRRLDAGAPAVSPGAVVPDYRRAADARINWEQRPSRPAGSGADRGSGDGGAR
jgi:tRNA threonylcarbamoyladenosine biosynthesis protein TsaB